MGIFNDGNLDLMIDRVCAAISASSRVRDVAVNIEGRQVILRGKCFSFYQKQLAQEAVADVDGVTQVINEIEVIRPNLQPVQPIQS